MSMTSMFMGETDPREIGVGWLLAVVAMVVVVHQVVKVHVVETDESTAS